MTDNIEDFFNQQSGGSGSASFDFDGRSEAGIGRSVHGEIVEVFPTFVTDINTNERKKDKNDNDIPQLNVTLQTELRNWEGAKSPAKDDKGSPLPASEDDGKRRVYLRYKASRRVADAINAAGATFADFKPGIGAQLYLKRIANDGQMMDFEAAFKKGAGAAPTDFLSQAASPAQEAPASTGSPWDSPAPATTAPAASPASSDEPPF